VSGAPARGAADASAGRLPSSPSGAGHTGATSAAGQGEDPPSHAALTAGADGSDRGPAQPRDYGVGTFLSDWRVASRGTTAGPLGPPEAAGLPGQTLAHGELAAVFRGILLPPTGASLSSGVFLTAFGSAWVEPCTGNPYARFGRAVPVGNRWSDSTGGLVVVPLFSNVLVMSWGTRPP